MAGSLTGKRALGREDGGRRYWRIGEVARLLGVKEEQIRYWERYLSGVPARVTPGKHRLYSRENIELLRFMRYLVVERGYKVQVAARVAEHWLKVQGSAVKIFRYLDAVESVLRDLARMLGGGASQEQ